MRLRLVTFTLPLLVSAALVAATIPASAGQTDAEQRFCEATTDSDPSSQAQDPTDNSGAHDLADYYRRIAKVAPKKSIKKALKTMAHYYDEFADIAPNNVGDVQDFLTSDTYKSFVKANAKYSKYFIKTCISSQIPST